MGMEVVTMGVHSAAAVGFGVGAETYVKGRPEYPAEVDGWLADELGVGNGVRVLDLGAGTGKFTRRLAGLGAEVCAVDAVPAMLEQLRSLGLGVEVKAGTAEGIPYGDGTFDVVVCAQSFHWFATAGAMAEIRRVLKPGGRLGLVWNVRDERVGWVAELTKIIAPYEGDAPRYQSGEWRTVFPAEGFRELQERRFLHGHTGSAERVIVDRTLSVSFIAALGVEERERVAKRVRGLIVGTAELAGMVEVTFPYETFCFWCVRA